MDGVLRLLGSPRRDTEAGSVELPPGQATHLASFLALRGDWVTRDEIVAMFWPEVDRRRGRHNLAQLLYAVRRSGWGNDIEVSPQRVRWPVPTDVAEFRRAASDGAWEESTQLYGGDLLEGVASPSSAALDEWLQNEREDVRDTWREATLQRSASLAQAGRWQEAARLLRRLLADDALLEEAVQRLMQAEAMAGRRDAALQVYGDFREHLAAELGLEPLEATVALAADVRSGVVAPATEQPLHAAIPDSAATAATSTATLNESDHEEDDVRPGPVRGLNELDSPFIGRSLELADLHGLLRHGAHRLVTVRGHGGTGKSRLARQLAQERSGHHADGSAWVPLADAANDADAVEAISRALGMRVEPDPEALARVLADRDLLLVLDQVEHVQGASGLAMAILDAAPAVQLLVTARSPLDVPGEAIMVLKGLAIPPRDDAADAEAYDAIALLLRAARRARPDFNPRGAEHTALVALARVLDGSPLGLELAAGWLRLLEPSEFLTEVRRDLDVVRTTAPDADPSRASLRAVFESSWSLLGESTRDALRRLAVFRGGCTRETALAVADVQLAHLLALTNRSLLRRDSGTRFVAHPVVHRFARDKLDAEPELADELEERHADFFSALATDADRRLDTPEQPAALQRLDIEGANIMAVLDRAIRRNQVDDAHALIAALGRLWRWRGRAKEGLSWCDRVRSLPGSGVASAARVKARLAEGLMLEKTGRYDAADHAFAESLADSERLGDPVLATAAHLDQATVAWRRGELTLARSLLIEVCASYRALGLEAALAGALGNLGNVMRDAGDLDAAHGCFDEALALVEAIGHVWEIANVLNNKAITFAYADDLPAARTVFERALALQRSINNRSGISTSLINLGNVNLDTGDPERAEELYREALALCEEAGDTDGVAHLNVNLGILAQWSGDYDEAHERYADALRRRRSLGARGLVAQSVSAFLDLAVARGSVERALVLAGAVRTLTERVGVPLTPRQQIVYDEALAKARAAVPPHRAADLEHRGEALSEAEVVDFALGTRVLA